MSGKLIETSSLGLSVFGTAQVSYTVDGQAGQSYDYAVAMTGLKRATAVENALPAYEAAVKARQTRATDLGNALADIVSALQTVKRDSKEMSKETVTITVAARDLLAKYGIVQPGSSTTINFFELQRIQTDVQYKLDVTNNDLQQDASMLQSFVSKRDTAFSMANKLMKKATQTFTSGVKYIV